MKTYKIFFTGVVIGFLMLFIGDSLPFVRFGFPTSNLRIVFGDIHLHHSILGLIGIGLFFLLKKRYVALSYFVLGISVVFFVSQLPEIISYRTLFW